MANRETKNVGYVCAYDQQVDWYQPQKKVDIGERIARCPLGNLVNNALPERTIPVPLFRSDQWDYPEAPFENDSMDMPIKKLRELREEAKRRDESRQTGCLF